MIVTDHAVARLIERVSPGMSTATARAKLEAHADSAVKLRQRSLCGDAVYLSESLGCRLIVRPSQWGEDGLVIATVLELDNQEDADGLTVDSHEPDFAPLAVLNDLVKTHTTKRPAKLAALTRDELTQFKAQNHVEMAMATEGKDKPKISTLNLIAAAINIELRKRPAPPPSAEEIQRVCGYDALMAPRADVRDLRRALGAMLFKYGWLGNEEARAVYQRVKYTGSDDASATH